MPQFFPLFLDTRNNSPRFHFRGVLKLLPLFVLVNFFPMLSSCGGQGIAESRGFPLPFGYWENTSVSLPFEVISFFKFELVDFGVGILLINVLALFLFGYCLQSKAPGFLNALASKAYFFSSLLLIALSWALMGLTIFVTLLLAMEIERIRKLLHFEFPERYSFQLASSLLLLVLLVTAYPLSLFLRKWTIKALRNFNLNIPADREPN